MLAVLRLRYQYTTQGSGQTPSTETLPNTETAKVKTPKVHDTNYAKAQVETYITPGLRNAQS